MSGCSADAKLTNRPDADTTTSFCYGATVEDREVRVDVGGTDRMAIQVSDGRDARGIAADRCSRTTGAFDGLN